LSKLVGRVVKKEWNLHPGQVIKRKKIFYPTCVLKKCTLIGSLADKKTGEFFSHLVFLKINFSSGPPKNVFDSKKIKILIPKKIFLSFPYFYGNYYVKCFF
jgi:hypothetical protein